MKRITQPQPPPEFFAEQAKGGPDRDTRGQEAKANQQFKEREALVERFAQDLYDELVENLCDRMNEGGLNDETDDAMDFSNDVLAIIARKLNGEEK